MFINRDDRLSRAEPPGHAGWEYGPRRAPRNWFKLVRLVLYALTGLLGAVAALAAVALLLGPQPLGTQTTPPPAPPPEQTAAAMPAPLPAVPLPAVPLPAVAPPAVAPPAVAPPAVAPPAVAPAAPAPPPAAGVGKDAKALQALHEQIRQANTTLHGLLQEADQIRSSLAVTARRRAAADAPSRPAAPATPVHPANAATRPPPAAPPNLSAEWASAERTIQSLAARNTPPAPATTPPPQPRSPPAQPAPEVASAYGGPESIAPAPPAGPKARVFLHYRAGSTGGMQAMTDIAQRLLFTNFVYADTRSSFHAPAGARILYHDPQDAPAARSLAALLADTGITFRVEAATTGRATPGRLDVWVGG